MEALTITMATLCRVTEVNRFLNLNSKCWISSFFTLSVCIFSAPGGDFSLDAGVSSVLQQLEAVCRESQQFRALNLDISCPAHLPHLTSCACVVKSRAGEVVRRENGTAGYTVRVVSL